MKQKNALNLLDLKDLPDVSKDYESIKHYLDLIDKDYKEYVKQLDNKFEKELNKFAKDNAILTNEIRTAYKNGKLVFVFGAGISKDFGLPDWNILLQKLILKSFEVEGKYSNDRARILAQLFQKIFSPSPLISARYLKNYFENNDSIKFENEVRKALYDSIISNTKSNLMDEILHFCVAPGKAPNLDSIITYNYDDILEEYLSKQKINIPFRPIYKVGMKSENNELAIYHIHGYLPRKGNIDSSLKITLSEDEYHRQYNDIYNWSNMIQINKFKDNTCLFIGVSLTDPNLRRILDIAIAHRGEDDRPHYIIKKRYDSKNISNNLKSILNRNRNLYNEKVMSKLMLSETTEYLVKMMERYEEADALSFGINTLWVENYKEIPSVLKSIRT